MFKNFQIALSISILLFSPCLLAQETFSLDSDNKKFSYAIGTKIGERLLQQFNTQRGFEMEALLKGLVASVSGKGELLSVEEADSIIEQRQQTLLVAANAQAQEKLETSKVFLEQNKSREGVTVTESGLQYKVVTAGESDGENPALADTVVVHYHGTVMDGTVFDSSYDRGQPASFSLQSIIPGWQEVLQLMKPGDKWEVVLPPELAYGDKGTGQIIGPNEVLLFDIELLEVKKSEN